MNRRHAWLPILALIALSLMWGYAWVVAKMGLSYASPFSFAAQRCSGGALALLVVLKLSGRNMRIPSVGPVICIGIAQTFLLQALQTWAMVQVGAGMTSILVFTMPIWTLLLAWPVLGERLRGAQWLAAILALGGLICIIRPWDMHANWLSMVLAVLSAVAWSVGTVLVKRLRSRESIDLLALTTWQMVAGSVVLCIVALLTPGRATDWTLGYAGILLFMALITTAVCWILWLYILDSLPAWEASLSILGIPVVAMVSSHWQLGESFAPHEIAGIAFIGVGLCLLSLLGWLQSRQPAT